ncbi:MAG: aminotransferase class I/II-fold pyridoxal phosphate-dependent enzyme, partial [Turicibacter sp.]
MKLPINSNLDLVSPSIIREMKNLADQFENVVDFTLGEPHLSHDTYALIHENLHQRLATEHIGYSNHYGLLELRIAIATHCKNNYQQDYDPQSELIITTGCSESISAVMGTLINKGDEVLIFEPAFS